MANVTQPEAGRHRPARRPRRVAPAAPASLIDDAVRVFLALGITAADLRLRARPGSAFAELADALDSPVIEGSRSNGSADRGVPLPPTPRKGPDMTDSTPGPATPDQRGPGRGNGPDGTAPDLNDPAYQWLVMFTPEQVRDMEEIMAATAHLREPGGGAR